MRLWLLIKRLYCTFATFPRSTPVDFLRSVCRTWSRSLSRTCPQDLSGLRNQTLLKTRIFDRFWERVEDHMGESRRFPCSLSASRCSLEISGQRQVTAAGFITREPPQPRTFQKGRTAPADAAKHCACACAPPLIASRNPGTSSIPYSPTPQFQKCLGSGCVFLDAGPISGVRGKTNRGGEARLCKIKPMWLVTQAENFFRYPTLLLLDSVLITLDGRSLSLTFL